jgi:GDP-L-fucose synthase
VTIRQLVETMASFIDFRYEFDASKPSGFPRRVMDISRAREWIGYEPGTSLRSGLQQTWQWFQQNKEEYLRRQNYFTAP